MTRLGQAVGMVTGYAALCLALRVAAAVDELVLDAHLRAAETARRSAELGEELEEPAA